MKKAGIGLLIVTLAGAAVWLWTDNRRLRRELGKAQTVAEAVDEGDGEAEAGTETAAGLGMARDEPRAGRRDRPGDTGAMLDALNRAIEKGDAEATNEDRGERRRGRWRGAGQWMMRTILGRSPTETEEEYQKRVAPLIADRLSKPRQRLEEERTAFEEAANVDPEQKAAMDQAFDDTYQELVQHANSAVAAGELTPYKRNSRGVLQFVAGAATIVDGLDTRLAGVLTPEQQQALSDSGFDIVEYLAVTTPWETLKPPPPEGGNRP